MALKWDYQKIQGHSEQYVAFMTSFNNLNVLKLKFQVTTLSCILLPFSQFAIGSALTSKSFNFPNTVETKTQLAPEHQIYFHRYSNYKMFRVFDSLHTYEAFDPFSPMWPLHVILELGNSFELQATVLALVSRNKENYFRFADERHRLLHRARWGYRLPPIDWRWILSDPFWIRKK